VALQAAAILASKAVTQVTAPGAAVQTGAGAMFAALLAKLNPSSTPAQPAAIAAQHNMISAPRNDNDDKAAGNKTAASSGDSPNSDLAASLAGMQAVTPLTTQAPAAPKTPDAISDALSKGNKPFADLKTADPADLRAALTQPAMPAKPGTPTLPVMPAHGDDDGEESAPAEFDAKNAPAMSDAAKVAVNNAVQHLLRPTTPAQTTEAQALPVKADAKQDGQNNASGEGKQNPSHDQSSYQQAQTSAQQAPAQTNMHAQAAVHAQSAPQSADVKTAAPSTAVAAIGATSPVQSAQAAQPATLQVTQAAHAAAQPDIAALAVSIAAKSQAGAKHFDIRLDPPELGRIEVHLSVDDAGKAQAHLSADKPQTLDLLQRDSSSLTRALKDSGVDLGSNGLQFSLRGQDQGGGNASRSFSRGRALSVSAVAEAAAPPSTNSIASDSARLDIRV
jgi:flagellar hook-length control protein FliK